MPMPRIERLWSGRRRAPGAAQWLSILEFILLAVLAVQLARLAWAIVTPVGAFGDWRGRQAQIPSPAARQALFAGFDPFYRTAGGGGGNAVVTSLALTLFGVRVNEGSGQGSAIIATPDGTQASFAVGDEIMPGVRLKEVAFDHVVIDRGGAAESVFLDQSVAAPVAAPGGDEATDKAAPDRRGGSAAPPVTPGGPRLGPTVDALRSDVGLAPRMEDGKVTGLLLTSRGPAFQSAGFQQGDVIREVNGRPIASAADLQALQSQLVPGARISLGVERGAAVVPIALTLQGQ